MADRVAPLLQALKYGGTTSSCALPDAQDGFGKHREGGSSDIDELASVTLSSASSVADAPAPAAGAGAAAPTVSSSSLSSASSADTEPPVSADFDTGFRNQVLVAQCLADDVHAAHPQHLPQIVFDLRSTGAPVNTRRGPGRVLSFVRGGRDATATRLRRVKVAVTVKGDGTMTDITRVIDGAAMGRIGEVLGRGVSYLMRKPSRDADDECCVCMASSPQLVLPCAHAFCSHCVMQWSRFGAACSPATFSCPMCRSTSSAGLTDDDSFELCNLTPVESLQALRGEVFRMLGCQHLEARYTAAEHDDGMEPVA